MIFLLSWVRLGLVDLRGDLSRFGIILACLTLGTAIVATIGSVGAGLQAAVQRDTVVLAGGDLEATPLAGGATAEEEAFLATLGQVTRIVNTTARAEAGEATAMVDLLAVSDNYPAAGTLSSPQLPDGQKPSALLGAREGRYGALVDERLLRLLGIGLGGLFRIGDKTFEVRGLIAALPDGATRGFKLGYPAIVPIEAYSAMADWRAPLPGLLTHNLYKLRLSSLSFDAAAAAIAARFAGRNWLVRSPHEIVGRISRYYGLFAKFTLIVALSSLLIGGVGVSNGVAAYLDERRRSIAVMRSLGATSGRLVVHFLAQVAALALIGVSAGMAVGAAAAAALRPIVGALLGARLPAALLPVPVLVAGAFGLLVSFAFSYFALMRARRVKPALLFRGEGMGMDSDHSTVDLAAVVPVALAVAAMVGLATLLTGDAFVVGLFTLGAATTIGLLRAAAWGLQRLLRWLPPLPTTRGRLAMHNVYRPGAPAPIVILSIGLGLAVLLAIGLIGANLQTQLLGAVRRDAPNFIIAGMFADEIETLRGLVRSSSDVATFNVTPQVEAEVLSINGRDPKTIPNLPEEAAFMLTGSIPVTYSIDVPVNSRVDEGAWWPHDYAGPPLVSLRDTMKFQLGLKIGDAIDFNIGGVPITARVASFRQFDWQDGSNLMVTFSPGAIDPAGASYMAAIRAPAGRRDALGKLLLTSFPDLTVIPVGDALDQAGSIIDGLARGINALAVVAMANGLLVLAGTSAAGRQQREAVAIVEKVLGATRRDVLASFMAEQLLLGGFAALFGVVVGVAVAWAVTRTTLEVPFVADAWLIVGTCAAAVGLAAAVGAGTTWRALSSSPAKALRDN